MIAVDLQPFSILEDIGFQRLMNHTCPNYQIPSRKFIKENIVQDIYTSVRNKIQEEINLAMHISFTSDGWSASTGNNSFLSLTAHWINDNYEQKSAILGVTPFEVSHTASNISECLQNNMKKYQIPDSKIHVIVRDNAANMTAGVTQAGYQSLGCFMHTLQLVLKDAIFEQRYVKDIIATCKQIVGHFNHSPSAFAKYTDYQIKFNLPEHRFIQDVDTRWNSQYYMLSRIFEQKTALIAYCSDHSKPSCLGTDQWKLLEKLQQILKHFVDCTNFLSADNAIASAIIPNMKVICHFFDKGEAKGLFAGLGSTLSAWKASVRNRFGSYFSDKNLILSTYLDPRFKTTFLADEYCGKNLEETLQQWMTEDICSIVSPSSICQVSESSDLSSDSKSDEENENAFNFSFDSCFAEFKKKKKEKSKETNTQTQEESFFLSNRNFLKVEMARYQELEMIKNDENSLQWWAANKGSFPKMSILAKKYLCAPPSSVQSERLFSIGGIIYSPKRNRLKSETGEMLMFLHYNLRIMGFKYL